MKKALREEVLNLIRKGVVYYGVGGARGFDLLAAEVVIQLREVYPNIKLIMVLPCENHYVSWNHNDRERFRKISSRADKIKVLSNKYYDGCMLARNRHLINNSSYLICYKRFEHGGTIYTDKYAQEKNIEIIYL